MTARRGVSTLDAARVERETGWRVVALAETPSTNDAAATLRDAGRGGNVVVVADRQTEGRGRGGNRFLSPEGGLYASVLTTVPSDALPAALVAAAGVALAEAVEHAAPGVEASLKWPNDLLLRGSKAAGILVEARADGTEAGSADAVVGIGVNLARVPDGLDPDVAAATTALDLHAASPVSREALLAALLPRLAARFASLDGADGLADVSRAWRTRLAWKGDRVRCLVGEGERHGVLVDASLSRGLCLAGGDGTRSWFPVSQVRELRRESP